MQVVTEDVKPVDVDFSLHEATDGADDYAISVLTTSNWSAGSTVDTNDRKASAGPTTLAEGLHVLGYAPEDKIDKDLQYLLKDTLTKPIEADLIRATANGQLHRAAKAKSKLERLNKEFVVRQQAERQRHVVSETAMLARAEAMLRNQTSNMDREEWEMLEETMVRNEELLTKQHALERSKLESELASLPDPMIKYSTIFLQLKKQYTQLITLKMFDQAKIIEGRYTRLKEAEDLKYRKHCEVIKNKRRQKLQLMHEEEQGVQYRTHIELPVKLQTRQAIRAKETDIRLTTHKQSMHHAQLLDSKKRMTIQPVKETLHGNRQLTAVSQGTALLQKAKQIEISISSQKPTGTVFNQDNLTSVHDFDAELGDGTIEFGQSILNSDPSCNSKILAPMPPEASKPSFGASPRRIN